MRAFFRAIMLGAMTTACAAETDPVPAPGPKQESSTTTPPPAQDSTPKPAPPAKEEPAPAKNECKLDAMTGVADVTPSFVVYSMPNEVPLAMTGGTLSGDYAVDGAKVYLPSGADGLVYPEESTGTINAWAVFDGTNYRLHLKGDFTLASVQGPLSQNVDTESQGGFEAKGEVIVLDHACNTAIVDEADYSFTDDGSGHATILIRTTTPYGDTYLQLDATKM
jgi:hypothetical protein